MEIPMEAIRCLAHEIEHKRWDFHVRKEIVESKCLMGVYEEGCVHGMAYLLMNSSLRLNRWESLRRKFHNGCIQSNNNRVE